MKTIRKIIEIDENLCDGCGQCVPACAEGAIQIVDGKARLISEIYCDGLGACLGECPKNALKIVERESEEFDPEAVEEYLKHKKESETIEQKPCCPAMNIIHIKSASKNTGYANDVQSRLTNWPVQIMLVPASAPFLKGSHLLVAADCTAFAYPAFHQDLLEGKALLVGCPKLDNVNEYVKKFTEIFNVADIKKITVLTMEVPCCSKLPKIIQKAMDITGKDIPIEEIIIGTQGVILQRGYLVR